MIGAAAFAVCFSLLVLCWDLVYRVRIALSIDGARRYSEVHAPRMARLVFALSAAYRNHRIHYYSNLTERLPQVFLLVANHQSIVDIPILVAFLPQRSFRFVAKSGLFRGVPLISPLLRLQRHASVDRRARRHQTLAELDMLALHARRGYCPVVFPEGTRSRDGQLGAFRSGAVKRILDTTALPVVTVAMDGGWVVSEAGQLVAGLAGCVYRVKIMDISASPGSRSEISAIVRRSRDLIDAQLKYWRK